MLQSMTAFARLERTYGDSMLVLEMRSVNHRFLDLVLRLPDSMRALEPALRAAVAERIKRGRIELLLVLEHGQASAEPLRIDEPRLKRVLDAVRRVSTECGPVARVDALEILRWPGVLASANRHDEALQSGAMALLADALDELIATRRREGQAIRGLLEDRLDAVDTEVQLVRERRPQVIERLRSRWLARLAELAVEVDESRLEQELAHAVQRLDVDEELDRLEQHILETRQVLGRAEPVGRRLDFLMQELNREANTLGAKAADGQTTSASVELKVLIEQMREQVQNIE